jgi:hypothetical protein
MPSLARARHLSTFGLMRVRVCSVVPSRHYIEMMEWILKHFDFQSGRILVNATEDIEYFEDDIRRCIALQINNTGTSSIGHLLHTYYFADDELGIYFRLRFA